MKKQDGRGKLSERSEKHKMALLNKVINKDILE